MKRFGPLPARVLLVISIQGLLDHPRDTSVLEVDDTGLNPDYLLDYSVFSFVFFCFY